MMDAMKITRVTASAGRYYYIQDLEERNPKTGRPKQRWLPLTRVDAGEAALLAKLAELLGTGANAGKGNMGKATTAFLKSKKPDLTPDVYTEYERMFKVIDRAFEAFDVDQVTPGDVLKFINEKFAGKPTTRRAYKARLSTFFAWCVLERLCAVNPCREIKIKSPPKRKARMDAEVYWQIHAKLPPQGQCFLELMYYTLQRPTEIRLLNSRQIKNGMLEFTPSKTEESSGARVKVRITQAIAQTLDRAQAMNRLKALPGGDAPVIQDSTGSSYTRRGIYEMWKTACDAAGLTGVTTRDVRPFALTTAEAMGHSMEDLRKAAAHTTVDTTEGYIAGYREVISPVELQPPPKKQKT